MSLVLRTFGNSQFPFLNQLSSRCYAPSILPQAVNSTAPWRDRKTIIRSMSCKNPPLVVHPRATMQEDWVSSRLRKVAEQLRHYGSPPSIAENGVVSSIGMPASEVARNDLKVFPTKGRAAVLVCLFQGDKGELRVILTKRAGNLKAHSGEVALPGGKRDEGDVDDAATALREAHEEIGLLPSQVRVVTTLDPFLSKNLLTVIPVIGLLDDKKQFTPAPNPAEVDAVFDAPLEMFLKDENYRFDEREMLGVKFRVHFFDYATPDGENFLIWGLTASVLTRTASIIYQRNPSFSEFTPDFEKFVKSAREQSVAKPDSTEDN